MTKIFEYLRNLRYHLAFWIMHHEDNTIITQALAQAKWKEARELLLRK